MTTHTDTIIPTVYEEDRRGYRTYYDIFSRLLKDRIIFITGPIESEMANIIIAQMVYLEKENSQEDIQIYIQSPGGSVSAGLAILDTMNYLKPNVVTIGMGSVASMASVLLSAGTKGKRYLLPNARVMIHQLRFTQMPGMTATDLQIENDEMQKNKKILNKILSNNSGQTLEKVSKDTERDYWMSAKETKDYGLVDKVLS